jgi:hypothetical protein
LKQTLKKIDWLKLAQILVVVGIMLVPVAAFAQLSNSFPCDPSSGLNCTAGTNINQLIRTIINWVLGIVFGIAVLFLILGGFWYIVDGGSETMAKKGKTTAVNALIGIVIIILSYVAVNVVSNLVSRPGQATGPG